ncbi:MAG: hypothetical protein KDA24_04590 [Deltaproteobacteria bacterium]|nr:hypothetical protein [Deltaproteobacteria bacterium]
MSVISGPAESAPGDSRALGTRGVGALTLQGQELADEEQRDRGAIDHSNPEATPVVLVHGFASDPVMWRGAERVLQEAGYATFAIAWEPEKGMDIGDAAQRVLAPAIDAALAGAGYRTSRPFHAIGHSTGGLLLRWLVEQDPFNHFTYASLTLLSTPNHGARTGVGHIACDTFRQPWRSIGCDLIPGSEVLEALGTSLQDGAPRTLSIGVETVPNLLPAPLFDGDGDGKAHSHDNAVMAESAWLEGATFRIWRGKRTRSHFTVACSSTVIGWVIEHMMGREVPPQEKGRLTSGDLCRD